MGRRAGFHWDKREQAYRTDAGGTTRYFRGIAREDHAGIAAAFSSHLAELDSRDRPPEPDVFDLVARFAAAARGIKARTKRTHKERLERFCLFPAKESPDVYGLRRASSLTAGDLRKALRAWEAAGLSEHYRAGICRSVKAAFAWAATEEGGKLIPSNPMAEVRAPAIGRSPQRYAERREVAAFLRFAWRRAGASPGIYRRFGRRLVLMMRAAAHTGARPGDLCSAWWSDFDRREGTITLPPDRHKTGRKTGRPRVIFLPPALVRALRRAEADPDRHPVAIFTHKRGKGSGGEGTAEAGEPWGEFTTLPDGRPSFDANSTPLSRAVRIVRVEAVEEARRRKAAGEPMRGLELIRAEGDNRFVMYLLRHTTASDHLMAGGDAMTVATLLGTSVKMLETTYGHLLHDHLSKTAGELARWRRKGTD
jgi:integrase